MAGSTFERAHRYMRQECSLMKYAHSLMITHAACCMCRNGARTKWDAVAADAGGGCCVIA